MPGFPESRAVRAGYMRHGALLGGKPVRGDVGACCWHCYKEASMAALPEIPFTATRALAWHGPG